mmetsp:Transcript_54462/g.128534  ORF Transcript_54462/g.128534 Transcript_54462/m.128534 type:complete len:231 (+) Transcript_54462:747-1439(+)
MKEGSSGEHTSFADRKMRLHPARVGCSSTYQNPRAASKAGELTSGSRRNSSMFRSQFSANSAATSSRNLLNLNRALHFRASRAVISASCTVDIRCSYLSKSESTAMAVGTSACTSTTLRPWPIRPVRVCLCTQFPAARIASSWGVRRGRGGRFGRTAVSAMMPQFPTASRGRTAVQCAPATGASLPFRCEQPALGRRNAGTRVGENAKELAGSIEHQQTIRQSFHVIFVI